MTKKERRYGGLLHTSRGEGKKRKFMLQPGAAGAEALAGTPAGASTGAETRAAGTEAGTVTVSAAHAAHTMHSAAAKTHARTVGGHLSGLFRG